MKTLRRIFFTTNTICYFSKHSSQKVTKKYARSQYENSVLFYLFKTKKSVFAFDKNANLPSIKLNNIRWRQTKCVFTPKIVQSAPFRFCFVRMPCTYKRSTQSRCGSWFWNRLANCCAFHCKNEFQNNIPSVGCFVVHAGMLGRCFSKFWHFFKYKICLWIGNN